MPMLEVNHVRKSYAHGGLWGKRGTRLVLEDISFALKKGECAALMGRSGAGKSTLTRILAGLERPDSGTVQIGGQAGGQNLHQGLKQGDKQLRLSVQLVFQNALASLNPAWTVEQCLAEPLRNRGLAPAEMAASIADLLMQVELEDKEHHMPCQLSGGQLQRVCLARALAARPSLLLLDEAFSGLDMLVQARMLDLLRRLCARHGLACLLVTHDARLAAAFCQRMLLLDKGRLALDAPSAAAFRASTLPAAQELVEAVL